MGEKINFEKLFEQINVENLNTFTQKNHDYGNAFVPLGLKGIFGEMRGGKQLAPVGFEVTARQIESVSRQTVNLIREGGGLDKVHKNLEFLENIKLVAVKAEMFGVVNALTGLINTLEEGRDAFVLIEDSKDIDMTPAVTAFNQTTSALDRMKASAIDARNALGLVGGISAQ